MSRFQTRIILESIPGRSIKQNHFRLVQDLVYRTDVLPTENIIRIEAPFDTDLGSIPRILWSIVGPPSGWYRDATIVHDWLCPRKDSSGVGVPHICDSDMAADVFYEGMIDVIQHSGWSKRIKRLRTRQAGIMRWAVRKYGPQFESDEWGGGA